MLFFSVDALNIHGIMLSNTEYPDHIVPGATEQEILGNFTYRLSFSSESPRATPTMATR
jgi:hypothetical protein